jgi:hypothetical protein
MYPDIETTPGVQDVIDETQCGFLGSNVERVSNDFCIRRGFRDFSCQSIDIAGYAGIAGWKYKEVLAKDIAAFDLPNPKRSDSTLDIH